MLDKNTTTLQSILRYALPLGSSLIVGDPETCITWAVNIRAQPPAFSDIYGGEMALVSMTLLKSYDTRMTVAEVIEALAEVKVAAAAIEGDIPSSAITTATEHNIALVSMPPEAIGLVSIERAVNKLILNHSAQITERAVDIQRQLTRLAAENRDLNTILQSMARALSRVVVIHDDAGVLIAQGYPAMSRRTTPGGRSMMQNMPYSAFQKWLETDPARSPSSVVHSPIGYTTLLRVEKRVAGYLSVMLDPNETLDDFERLVLTYGADVCAVELAKSRAIASAVEQARGDWVQMWLSGTPADEDLLFTRAQQAGFDPRSTFVVVVFRAMTGSGQTLPLESLISLVRDDMLRRQLNGAVGQYVDVIVALYPLEDVLHVGKIRNIIEDVRAQLATRTPSGLVTSGVSRPSMGLAGLRDSYREAKDSVSIAGELGDTGKTTYYGDLKLYQLLLALKERNLDYLRRFYHDTLGPLVEHDERKQSDLVHTLNGFFKANGNLAEAAKDLKVHRNTLVYRLQRISELTELNLDDSDNRLILHLALKIQRVLATIPGRSRIMSIEG